mmetsp:Transcript_12669/g.35660  ORF Transcript_12669/g.35660 Transcript_12669/m.35660 type:complete len:200 (+) Transcript_12669:477-1076(+)
MPSPATMAVIHNAPGSIGLSGSSRLSARLAFRLAFRRRTPAGAFVSTRGFFMPAAVNDPYSAPATAPGSFAAEVPLPELTATMASTGPAAKTATANYVQTASLTRVFIGIGAGARPLSGLLSGPMSVVCALTSTLCKLQPASLFCTHSSEKLMKLSAVAACGVLHVCAVSILCSSCCLGVSLQELHGVQGVWNSAMPAL